jgi:hypothetical protein
MEIVRDMLQVNNLERVLGKSITQSSLDRMSFDENSALVLEVTRVGGLSEWYTVTYLQFPRDVMTKGSEIPRPSLEKYNEERCETTDVADEYSWINTNAG